MITCLQKGNSAACLRESSKKTGSETTLKSLRSVKEREEMLHENNEIAVFGEHHSDVSCFFFLLEGNEGLWWSRQKFT